MSSLLNTVVIVGAGIAGSVQALLLARAGFNVTLVEAQEPASVDEGLNVRSVALSCRSRQLLDNHGLWPTDLGCPINEVHTTIRGQFGSVRLTARDLDVSALGYVVANTEFERYLLKLVEAERAIELICPATARLICTTANSVQMQIGSETVEASLLIAADGSHSPIRESLGIEVSKKAYDQFAIVANLGCQRDHRNIAFERFTECGPLALLPLAEKRVAMVYSATTEATKKLRGLSDDQFLRAVQELFGGKLGRLKSVGRRAVFPLELIVSRSQVTGCSVLIGNAARTIHPVAGQGLNLALRDVFELSSQLTPERSVAAALEEFSIRRRADQQQVIRQTNRLAETFVRKPWPLEIPLSLAKSPSMLLLDNIAPMRNRFGASAAGLRLPANPSGA
ncbi:hypothetical protein AB833_30190 [Chromatiales bacterium (ex Bugula neritina AB1)]|nr:hypothetical protein AB833_30190 [Chromatiales bacterium (ex Bugula neritina AB1)]